MEINYPKSYATRIMATDALLFLIGLGVFATPFAMGNLPGAFDTTVHVALGALIAALAVFRVLVAYGSAWVEVPMAALGVLVFFLPKFMHMYWNPTYATPHMIAGVAVIVLAFVSGLMTTMEMRKPQYAIKK